MGDGFVLTAKTFWQKIIIYPIPIWGLIFEQAALPQEAFWQKIIIYPIPIWGLIFEQTALPQEALS